MSTTDCRTLNWSEEREPCEWGCRYNHCFAETPFGKIVISWKGCKEYPLITVYEAPFSDWFSECWDSVEEAKSWCQAEYSRRLAAASPVLAVAPVGGLLGLDDLRDAWNAQADAANSWDELGLDEIIHFAQQAIVRQCCPAVVPVAWCRSDEFANAMNRGGSFNGWRDPGAGFNKCDMQLYAIPLPTTTQEANR